MSNQHYAAWYKTARWRKVRARQLAKHPYCQCPHHRGKDRSAIATVCDHITPHRGDRKLFWSSDNLQSMCKGCHDKGKQSLERGGHGFSVGCGPDGNPLDPDHDWYQR